MLTRETRELSGVTPRHLERALAALKKEGASGIFKMFKMGHRVTAAGAAIPDTAGALATS